MLKFVGKFVLGLATPLTATMIGAYLVQQYMPPRVVAVAPPPPPFMMMPASELAKLVAPPPAAAESAAPSPAQARQAALPARPAAAPRPPREAARQPHAGMASRIASPVAVPEEAQLLPLAPATHSPGSARAAATSPPPPMVPMSARRNDPLSVSADDRARLADVPYADAATPVESIEEHRPTLLERWVGRVTSVLREPR